MTREEAMQSFAELVRSYGLQWTGQVPREAWDELRRVDAVLSRDDKVEALRMYPTVPAAGAAFLTRRKPAK